MDSKVQQRRKKKENKNHFIAVHNRSICPQKYYNRTNGVETHTECVDIIEDRIFQWWNNSQI